MGGIRKVILDQIRMKMRFEKWDTFNKIISYISYRIAEEGGGAYEGPHVVYFYQQTGALHKCTPIAGIA